MCCDMKSSEERALRGTRHDLPTSPASGIGLAGWDSHGRIIWDLYEHKRF